MNTTISPIEFLIANVICFTAGAVAVVAMNLVAKAAYGAGRRKASADV